MKRLVASVGVGVLLVGVGIAVGALTLSRSDSSSKTTSDLNVVSRWSGKAFGYDVTLYSGSVQGDPGHGAVLVETSGHEPAFFSAPAGTGAFRLESHWDTGWTFRAADGSLAVVGGASPATGAGPSFAFLGKALDPAHLGPIAKDGVAIPIAYGAYLTKQDRYAKSAVVLVESDHGQWKLDGYLPGYWIPRRTVLGEHLQRPLVSPDGTPYLVDAQQKRLVRDTGWRGAVAPGDPVGTKFGHCATWELDHGYSYQACPNAITRQVNGVTTTLFQRSLGKQVSEWAWNFVQPSPDGKWLLVEDSAGFCGNPTWADFLPAGGGALQAAFPGALTSEALGWLPDNSALVAAQPQGCPGPAGGIYQVYPPEPSPPADPNLSGGSQLVFAGPVVDATTWGFGH